MFVELPQNLILMTAGAFLLGWILSAISSRMDSISGTKKRDPRDDRIRSMDAELRIAQSELEKSKAQVDSLKKEVEEVTDGLEKRDNVISHQQERIDVLKKDLKDSVLKTRELRAELSDRAAESVRSEVKLREVETELSVAQASTDMLATGVLDYSSTSEKEEHDEDADLGSKELSGAAT